MPETYAERLDRNSEYAEAHRLACKAWREKQREKVVEVTTDDILHGTQQQQERRLSSTMKRQVAQVQAAFAALEARCDLLTAIDGIEAHSPAWLTPVRAKEPKKNYAIVNTISSDQHFDEVISLREMGGVNCYNRRIAKLRLDRHYEKVCSLAKDFLGGHTYEGAHVWWLGDAFTGNIHEELTKTNDGLGILESLEYWLDPVIANFVLLAGEFGKLHISARRGNHTRTSQRTPAKRRVVESYDWLFMRLIQRELRGDSRITFDIPESDDGEVIAQYNTKFLATHGDQFRGGSGISGILTPLKLGAYKKERNHGALDTPFDVMLMGHFHQYMTIPGIIVNGSLKGFDEYAYVSNFGYEPPQQAFWLTTPGYGPAFHVPIRPQDRKRERW